MRKVSGYLKPSPGKAAAFDAAVEQVSATARDLLAALAANHPRARSNVS